MTKAPYIVVVVLDAIETYICIAIATATHVRDLNAAFVRLQNSSNKDGISREAFTTKVLLLLAFKAPACGLATAALAEKKKQARCRRVSCRRLKSRRL